MRAFAPHLLLTRPRARLSIAIACFCAAPMAYAQQAQVAVDDAKTLDTLTVTADGSQVELPPAYAGGQIATGGRVGLFGNLDVMDTPFNSLNFTADLIRNQQARSVADVVQNDPAVRVARGFGNFQELYVVRGFPVNSDDMSYNGLYGLLPRQYVAAELLERVEVFRGANSFINGAAPGGSGVGGVFNLVPKRAGDVDLTRLTFGYESDGQGLAAADVSRRFGADRAWGVRVNAVRRDGDTSIDGEKRKLSVLSLGLDYRGERARFSADLGYQNHRIDAPRPNVTPSGNIPSAPDADINYAQRWTYTEERDVFGVVRGEYDFTDNLMGWAAAGMRQGKEDSVLANPTSDADGNVTAYRFDNARKDQVATGEVGLRGKFTTGSVGHKVSVTAAAYNLDSKNAYAMGGFGTSVGTLSAPVNVAPFALDILGGDLSDPGTTSRIKTRSAALADVMSFFDNSILLTLGARWQKIQTFSYAYGTGKLSDSYDAETVTPVAAVVFKLSKHWSLYGNYAQALQPGEIVPASVSGVVMANAGQVLNPYKSKQHEVGVKYDQGSFGMTTALFRIDQPNTIVQTDQSGVSLLTTDGQQRNQGLEYSVYGQPAEGLRVIGGLTWLQAKYKRTQTGDGEGNYVIGVPKWQSNLGVEWDVPALQGLSVNGRVTYTGKQYADSANSINVGSTARFDIGAGYAFEAAGKAWNLRGRVDNLFDRSYWASVGGYPGYNYLVQAMPRTFTLSLSVDL